MAHQYDVSQLLISARDKVVSLTNKASAVHVWRYAVDRLDFPHGKAIAYRAFQEVRDNFGDMAAAPKKDMHLDKVDDAGMELLLRSNDLVVCSEDTVLDVVVNRLTTATPGPQYQARAAWTSLVRWGRLSQTRLRNALKHLDSGAAAADSSKRWVAAYTRGLQDVLHMHINNGEARLRPGNVRRGGSGEHILVVASTVATGSGVQVSAPLLVGAHLWQLSVDGGGAEDAKKTGGGADYLPVTLTRLPPADVTAAAGIAAPAAVRVKADLFTFELRHQATGSVPGDCDAVYKARHANHNILGSQSVVLRREPSAAHDGGTTAAAAAAVVFPRAVPRAEPSHQYSYNYSYLKRAPSCDGRLGVGVAFSLTAAVA